MMGLEGQSGLGQQHVTRGPEWVGAGLRHLAATEQQRALSIHVMKQEKLSSALYARKRRHTKNTDVWRNVAATTPCALFLKDLPVMKTSTEEPLKV